MFNVGNRNFVYHKLVKDENDFVGMVAYTIYKKSKITYIQKLNNSNRSKGEIDDILSIWQESKCSDDSIKSLRDMANNYVATFTTKLISQKQKELIKKEKNLEKREQKLEKKVN